MVSNAAMAVHTFWNHDQLCILDIQSQHGVEPPRSSSPATHHPSLPSPTCPPCPPASSLMLVSSCLPAWPSPLGSFTSNGVCGIMWVTGMGDYWRWGIIVGMSKCHFTNVGARSVGVTLLEWEYCWRRAQQWVGHVISPVSEYMVAFRVLVMMEALLSFFDNLRQVCTSHPIS
jgi:hypothetical protein